MIAYLNKARSLPVFSDVFRITVMIGSSSGMHCFSNQVGMGSSAQDELDADSIVFCISSEVANLRQSSLPSVNELCQDQCRNHGKVVQFWFTNSVFTMLNKSLVIYNFI